tara:strand:- start:9073 stop:9675 length:603 start_codon:yes stop_codon:yes gene_type:complete
MNFPLKNLSNQENKVESETSLSPDISEDTFRVEEPWTIKGESLIHKWNSEIKDLKNLHEKSGYYYKKMRKRWGLPAIVLPAIMAPFSTVFADYFWIKYVNAISFMVVAFMSSIDSFYSFATRKEKHFNHSTRYSELSTMIDSELLKQKKFRIQSDVFTTQIRMRLDMLNTIAPVIPMNVIKEYESEKKETEPAAVNEFEL